MDEQYLTDYNRLFFDNLCDSTCLSSLGQDKGLNNILLTYYDYFIQKYQSLLAAGGTYNLSILYSSSLQTKEGTYLAPQTNSGC